MINLRQMKVNPKEHFMLGRTLVPLFLCVAAASAQVNVVGAWRIEHVVAAPWEHTNKTMTDFKTLIGKDVKFGPASALGPGVLTCTNAVFKQDPEPADGLFQGNLPAPAKKSAEPLGIVHFPVLGVRMNCSTGSFDFHRVDANTLMIAMDNAIWTLTRAPGALMAEDTPSGVVQRFLEAHFAGDMGFDVKSVRAKEKWFTPALKTAIAKYMAKPDTPNEVPAIDGDPFTDSQEYPTRFAVAPGVISGAAATVVVKMSDGYSNKLVVYNMRQIGGAWLINDVHWGKESLVNVMKAPS